MKIVDLSSGSSSASPEATTDRKRQISPTAEDDVDLSNIDAELTRNIGLQKKKLAKLNLELQQLSEDIADQSPCTSRDLSTITPIYTFFDRPLVHRSQPIDIQYSVASWRTMGHRSSVKIVSLHDDVVEESPAAIEPYGHQVDDAVSQDGSIDMNTAIAYSAIIETKELKAQEVSEPSPTVALQFRVLRKLFVYANAVSAVDLVKRPEVQLSLKNLCILTEALCDGHMYQSDATSMIASSLSSLMNSITVVAERGNAAEYGETVELVINLNQMLKECYKWDPDKALFLGPLDVQDFNDVLTYFTLLANVDISETYIKRFRLDDGAVCANLGILSRDKLNLEQMLLATFNVRRLERAQSQQQISHEPRGDMLSERRLKMNMVQRNCADEGMAYVMDHDPQDDPLEFLWSDPEDDDEDNDQYDDETDGSETASANGIFDSATEISGADVTENDWSEIDRESD
ncbi:unnamed protein product [Umbelopsis ramanniana]